MLNEELQAYLDGDRALEELPPDLREEARRWDDLVEDIRAVTGGEPSAPAGLERQVMRALPEHPDAPWWERALDWLLRPRTVEVSPLAGAAAAAALVLVALVPALWTGAPGGDEAPVAGSPGTSGSGGPAAAVSAGQGEAPGQQVYVEFRLRAPDASSVAVAGDFTNWEPAYYLSDVDGDGVWTGRVPLRPGLHEYMFVVDGDRWVTDPGAERYADDGFGHRNAVVTISST